MKSSYQRKRMCEDDNILKNIESVAKRRMAA